MLDRFIGVPDQQDVRTAAFHIGVEVVSRNRIFRRILQCDEHLEIQVTKAAVEIYGADLNYAAPRDLPKPSPKKYSVKPCSETP